MSLEQENNVLRQRITDLEQQLQNLQMQLQQQSGEAQATSERLETADTRVIQLTQPEATTNHFFQLGSIALSFSESEELFRAYIEAVNDMVYVVDLEGRLTFVNPYGQRLLGCDPSDLLGRFYLEFVAAGDRERTAQAFANLLTTGELTDFEFSLQPKLGPAICMEVNGRLLYRGNELVGGIGIARDISERKRFEKQLQMFLKAMESAYDSTVITNLQGEIIYANPATMRMFGIDLSAANHLKAEVFYPEEGYNLVQWLIQKAIAGGWSGEVICQRHQGDRFPALVSVGSIANENGQPEAICIISRDITSQKQTQAELAAKNIELERASRLKSAFLANMSHELRTPLTSILGFSSLLEQQMYGPLSAKQQVYVEQIRHSGEHLLNLINDVLDLSKVEAGQIVLNIAPIAVDQLCENTLNLVSEQARLRDIEIHQHLQSGLSPLIADELRVRQMLLNLLSNAIKFSHPGSEIGLEASAQAGYLRLTVWDRGIGIPSEKHNLLFQPFQQLDSSLARQHEGTGLGLALTRHLAELHGGTVEFESREGQGSRFTLCLPLQLHPKPLTSVTELPLQIEFQDTLEPQTVSQILVVEDHPLNAMLLRDILQHWGYNVQQVSDGLQALAWLETHTADLILLDIHLPALDGFEFTRQLRANPKWQHIPIIAATALAMVGDRDRCLAAGMQDYISKPLDYEQLANVLAKYTGHHPQITQQQGI